MHSRLLKLVSITLAFILFAITCASAHTPIEKQRIGVSMRMIGHQILLNAHDSTSRLLPIIKEHDRYRISFESDFGINPEDLLTSVSQVFANTEMSHGYILEVEQCETKEIVYSYQVGNIFSYQLGNKDVVDIIPCKMRSLPKSCYTVLITLMDENGDVLSSKDLGSNINKHSYVGSSHYIWLILILAMVGSIYLVNKRRTKAVVDPDLIRLGEYVFDKKNTKLTYDQNSMELTSKEADLLLLLYNAVNTNVEREEILKGLHRKNCRRIYFEITEEVGI